MSWSLSSLGELVTIKGGGTPSKKVDEYWDGNIPWASVKDLKSNKISRTVDSISLLGVKESSTNLIPSGTIITATRMALGKFAINEVDMAINQDLKALFIKNADTVDRDYLIRFLESKSQFIDAEGKGATVKGVTLDFLKAIEIPLPPIEEQKRIAAILDKADAIRRKRQQAIQLADDFLRSVFLDMFGDPVTNPMGWEMRSITDLVSKDKYSLKRGPFGGALKKEIFVEEGYLVYEQYHALNNDFSFARYFIDESKYQELNAFKVHSGDIIISCSGVNLGRLAIVPEESSEGIINQALLKVKLDNSKMLNEMFVNIFTHPNFKREFFGDSRGSGVPNFPPMSAFKEFGFIAPPIELQYKFLEVLEKFKSMTSRIQNSSQLAHDKFNSVSQKAFAGEL